MGLLRHLAKDLLVSVVALGAVAAFYYLLFSGVGAVIQAWRF